MTQEEIIEHLATKFMERNEINNPLTEPISKIRKQHTLALFSNIFKEFEEYPTLTKSLNLMDINDPKERIKQKEAFLLNNPDEEYWDNLEYIPFQEGERIPPCKYALISTSGRLKFINDKGYITENNGSESPQYARILFRDNDWNTHKPFLHRAVASTFKSIPDRLINENENLLETNHIDGNINNNFASNLEWMTKAENIRHAIEIGLKKTGRESPTATYYIGTVEVKNKYHGMTVCVCGTNEINKAGFNLDSMLLSIKSKENLFGGCSWVRVNPDDPRVHNNNDPELMDRIANDKPYMNARTKPIIATIVVGIHKGKQFSYYGINELKAAGFDQGHVSRVCNGKLKTHRGCSWKYVTFEEAEKHPRNIPKEIMETL